MALWAVGCGNAPTPYLLMELGGIRCAARRGEQRVYYQSHFPIFYFLSLQATGSRRLVLKPVGFRHVVSDLGVDIGWEDRWLLGCNLFHLRRVGRAQQYSVAMDPSAVNHSHSAAAAAASRWSSISGGQSAAACIF